MNAATIVGLCGFIQYINAIQKHPWCKKSEAKSEAPVTSSLYATKRCDIRGRGQIFLRFNHFVDAAICNHVQTCMHIKCCKKVAWPSKTATKRTDMR